MTPTPKRARSSPPSTSTESHPKTSINSASTAVATIAIEIIRAASIDESTMINAAVIAARMTQPTCV